MVKTEKERRGLFKYVPVVSFVIFCVTAAAVAVHVAPSAGMSADTLKLL